MGNELRLKITYLEAGQPGPYADSRYRIRLEMEYDPPLLKSETVRWTGDSLLHHAAKFAWASRCDGRAIRFGKEIPSMKFMPKSARDPEWHEPRITAIKEIEPGVAEVLIIEPFKD